MGLAVALVRSPPLATVAVSDLNKFIEVFCSPVDRANSNKATSLSRLTWFLHKVHY